METNKELTLFQKIGEVQQAIGKISKDKKNPFYKSSYFDINGLLDVLMPELKKQGLVVMQPISCKIIDTAVVNSLMTIISDGDKAVDYSMALPMNIEPQKLGSAITYYRRYSLQSLFCLSAEDDDANATKGTTPAKKETTKDIDFS